LRIALDATYSLDRNLSGVGVYSREILRRLPEAHRGPSYVFCYRPHRFIRSFRSPLPKGVRRALLWKGWPHNIGVFHALNQRVDPERRGRVVSTFHDLFVITSDYSTAEFRQRFARQAREAAERSDLIIAVSAFTASQVEELLGVERSRIRVVHHGVSRLPTPQDGLNSHAQSASSPHAVSRMILFVGAIQKRKNISRLVEAFSHTPPGWKLTLAGSAGFGAERILEDIERSPRRADIELPGYVSDAELAALYRRAGLFAFPSLDEGFGMPILEAMAHGVPVLTSNTSALSEIAGHAAVLVDPYGVNAIGEGLNELISNQKLRGALVEQGFERAASFTWEAAVEKTWMVYRELLG
jgi:glycosyltransferase involved in cell wall biosynthesis